MTPPRALSPADLGALAQSLGNARREGSRWRCRCPVCGKDNLELRQASDGTALLYCFSPGCRQPEVVRRLKELGFWPAPGRNGHAPTPASAPPPNGHRPADATAVDGAAWWAEHTGVPWAQWHAWGATAIPGGIAFTWPSLPGVRKLRFANGPKGLWAGSPTPPLWPELPERLPETTWVAEGESDAGVLRHCGLEAYACTKGASAGLPNEVLAELRRRGCRRLVIAFDADDAGRAGAEKLAWAAHDAGLGVATVSWDGLLRPELGEKDARDLARRLADPAALRQALAQAARDWAPSEAEGEGEGGTENAAAETTPATVGMAEPATSPPAPPFPLDLLPPLTQAYVRACAQAIVCPPDFIALPLLVAAGAAVGGACELELKPGWLEGTNLYAAIVGSPGSKKSPALDTALRPLHRVQALLARDWQAEHERYEADLREWEAAPKAERGPKPQEPPFPHLFTTDATCEALTAMLVPGRGVLLELDELAGWVLGMNQYKNGKGADRQFYLKCWGRAAVKTDRRTHPKPLIAERPQLSVVGGIQPDLLSLLADPLGREDGFTDRLLLAFPEPVPDRWTDAGVDDALGDRLTAAFWRLRRWAEQATPEGGEPAPVVVRFDRNATELWRQWYVAHGAEPAPEGLAGPWAKLPSQAARLALTLHCLLAAEAGDRNAAIPERLDAETLAAALDLVDEYIKPHWQKAAPRLKRWEPARAPSDLGLRVLQALRQHGALSMRGLHALFGRNLPAERLRAVLEDLEAAGLVRRESAGRHGQGPGRPAEIWTVADPAHAGPQ